ncbi:MAG: serine--tRNA ligase [Bifidobacterium thermacidophilum]|jgi:seryl-tRNA synthetase|nr:serine--tRNA ligase [Bifidobacterium thermacidophilum]
MLDIQFIREHPDIAKESQRKRGESVELVDEVLRSDETRRESLKAFEAARAEQKDMGKKIATAAPEEKAKIIAQTKELSNKVSEYKDTADQAAAEYTTAMWKLSNIVEPEAPEGGEDDYVVVKKVGTIRDFAAEGFEPKNHLELGEGVAGIDMKRGVKVSGSRFYFLRGAVARLQIAMLTMAVDQAEEHGFTLAITPTLVRPEVMAGTGFLNSHADEIYRLREPDDQYLVGTSEVALAGMHENEILDLDNGPLRYCGWSSCYRREAGAAGKDTMGIIRVHQFDKVEMFVYCKQENSRAEHQHLLQMEQEMLGKVEVPYRIIDTAAGDLGASAARKFDCEAWVPTQNRYRELTSTSNCTEYQARRLNIRERTEDGSTRAVSTLNGTLATTRWLVAILENHQQADGSIEIPKAMRPYMGGKEVIEPRKWEA